MPVDYEEKIRFFIKCLLIFRMYHEDIYFSGMHWNSSCHTDVI